MKKQKHPTLEEIANEYVTQENKATAHPIALVVTDQYIGEERRQVPFSQNELFLTKQSAKRHIEENAHHYHEPRYHIVHVSDRNPDMRLLIGELYKKATVPHSKWNNEALHYYKKITLEERGLE